MATASLASCSSDYLEVAPETAVTNATVFGTEEGVEAAVIGLCRAMYSPYAANQIYQIIGFNGEPFIQVFYGDVMGQDYFSYMWAAQLGNNFRWTNNRLYNGWMPAMGWAYCYNLISQANSIIANIEHTHGDRDVLDFYKAQAHTIRAHAYVRILQIYGPRWEDSNNGEAYVAPLRIEPTTGDIPLSKMKDIIALIKSDLDTALELYLNSNANRGNSIWQPDEDIARGVYARLGLLIHDYDTAEKMAAASRAPYRIMTAAEYKGGFAEPTPSYIWANPAELNGQGIGYFAHGSYYACQGPYPTDWELGGGQINYELYRLMPAGDIRRDLFFTPDKLSSPTSMRVSSFWNKNICNPADMDLSKLNSQMKQQLTKFGNSVIPNGDTEKFGRPYVSRTPGEAYNPVIAFGAQYKFWGLDMYGTNSFPYMRAEEMLLNEAEAAYYNGHEQQARNCIAELVAVRNPGQNVSGLSGQALLDEIRLQRRMELWGEGFNWYDLKRWNLPMVRNPWKEGDVNSNNIPASYTMEIPAADMRWRYIIPITEVQYNPAIDISLVQ